MATKNTPVNENEELEGKKADSMQAEIERLRAENEALKRKKPTGNPYGSQKDSERVREACEKAAAEGVDPWDETISVRAPRRPAKEDPWYWINVNGRSVQVPANDRYYDLKLPWAAALTDMIEAEWHASDFQDKIEVFDPVTNPHRN